MRNNFKKGVTLIELLITIAIISILAVVIVSLINPVESGRKSRDAKRISDLATLKRAIDLALADKQTLSTTGTIILSPTTDITYIDGYGLNISKYLPAIPQDPSHSLSGSIQVINGGCEHVSVNRNSIVYEFKSDEASNTYAIRARLESKGNCAALSQDGFPSDYYEMGTKLDSF